MTSQSKPKQTQKGSLQSPKTRKIGPSVRICQLNVEGISKAKCEYLSKILTDHNADVVTLQETHTNSEEQFQRRGIIPGYTALSSLYHHAYGSATYVKSTIKNASLISSSCKNNVHTITIKINSLTITNVYKPPGMTWPEDALPTPENHPAVYIGDFNSHSTVWGYGSDDVAGTELTNWAETNNLYLVHDAKQPGSFRSAAWRRDYNPDLCFVSRKADNIPLASERKVLSSFPHSQHRPVLMTIGVQIPLISSIPKPRWNFNKADWKKFQSILDKTLHWIPAKPKNYDRFCGAIMAAAKKSIPRGYRDEYIPGWDENSQTLYEEYLNNEDPELADEILQSLDTARRDKWSQTVAKMDFKHSSRKAWGLLRKLGSSTPPVRTDPAVTPDQIANHIVSTSRAPSDKNHTTTIKKELSQLKRDIVEESEYSESFSKMEIENAIKEMKTGKAPGYDGIHVEFLAQCGPVTKSWLAKFYSEILCSGYIPPKLKNSKIISILKPGKDKDKPESYRPIALLSSCYKLLERLIYNRISETIMQHIPIEQAGFRKNRSCCDQVLSLTTFIEAGFQNLEKSSVVFIDLTAAYDTVWRQGLTYKLLKTIRCKTVTKLIDNMLSNRTFQVHMDDQSSRKRTLNNGLPQGSVLAPLLFNLYVSDLPKTRSKKFNYADDMALGFRHKNLQIAENVLNEDLEAMNKFFIKWRLKPSVTKTETSCFHLNNKMANTELHVEFNGTRLKHNKHPKYLGVTLDRTLSFRKHLTNVAAKLRTRNNIISKLSGTSWGASAETLRCSSLGLVFSTAEYCAPVWLNSPHSGLVDVQLNNTLRIISGTIKPTPTYWLPTLCNISPAHLRRSDALCREYRKILSNPQLQIHEDIDQLGHRLRSRKPPIQTAAVLTASNFKLEDEWAQSWQNSVPLDIHNNLHINESVPGSSLPRKTWCYLNRIRTECGVCADSLYKWGKTQSNTCDCGEQQTIHHIAYECVNRQSHCSTRDFLGATPSAVTWIENLDIKI